MSMLFAGWVGRGCHSVTQNGYRPEGPILDSCTSLIRLRANRQTVTAHAIAGSEKRSSGRIVDKQEVIQFISGLLVNRPS
jgi:hypothetical protein